MLCTLAHDPAQRMKSADELAKALEALPHRYRSATDQDVAEHIRQWFAAERQELRERIDGALARASLLTPLPSLVTAPGVEVGIHGSGGGSSPADRLRTPLTSLAPWEATAAAALVRRPWKAVAGVAATIALVLLGFAVHRSSTPVASGPLPTVERRATAAPAESPPSEPIPRETARAPAASSSAVPLVTRGPTTPKANNSWRPPGAPAAASAAPPAAEPPSLGADVPKNWRLNPGF